MEAFTASATPGNSAYKIGPQDVLDVSVFKVPELSKSVQVADSGSINLPLVGEVPAAGLTAQEVERDLTKRLGAKYLQSPQVTVFVKEYNSQRVTIEGAVKKPGVYPVRGKTSLLQSIAMAEGLDAAAQDEIVVFRQINGKRVAGKFDVAAIRDGQCRGPRHPQWGRHRRRSLRHESRVAEFLEGDPGRRLRRDVLLMRASSWSFEFEVG